MVISFDAIVDALSELGEGASAATSQTLSLPRV
jgi:hypothetical protein